MQDHPKVSYRFELALEAPAWPAPWYQCLLTGAHEVGGERRVYQVMPYSGTVEGGQRYTDLNVQVADARSRRGIVRLQSRDPADQPAIEMGWFLEPSDRAAAVAAGRRLLEVARTPPLAGRAHALARASTTPTRCCGPSRPSTTRSAPAGWAGRTTPRRSSTAPGACASTEGLWVMDASVIARVPSANTHLAVIALAERLAAAFRAGA